MHTGNRGWTLSVETERVVVVSRHGRFAVGWCADCGQIVDLWSDADVRAMTNWSVEQVASMLAASALHGTQLDDGSLRLCAKALRMAIAGKPRTD